MSASTIEVAGRRLEVANPLASATRRRYTLAALACVAILTGTYLSALFAVTDVVGGTGLLAAGVLGALALAVVLGRTLGDTAALALAAALLAVGLLGYLLTVPPAYYDVLTPGRVVQDVLALLTGYSIIQMTNAGVWAVVVAPGPVFLTWFFAVRGQFVRAATVGGLVLGFFVLTSDADIAVTLLGALAAAGAVAFATLDRHGGGRRQAEVLAAALAVAILASTAVSAVPGGGASPVLPESTQTVEGSLVAADDHAPVYGSLRLSPKVRFVVEADNASYWRVAAYDRFTGDSWVRTGTSRDVDLPRPPGSRTPLEQEFFAKQTLNVLPAAAQPVAVAGARYRVTEQGTLTLDGTLREGNSVVVTSLVSTADASQLRRAGTDYPEELSSTYLEVPESTGDRVASLTANITADADTPYAAATDVETWLERNKQYSLDVTRPQGDVVESFLFDMNRGYCVYYASAMTTMLRTQGIPARYVVGYTSGQRVERDTWVVRGLDAHAWVEAYFPDVGWVRFDPTPGNARGAAESDELRSARENGVSGVDAAGSADGTWTPPRTTTPPTGSDNETGGGNGTPGNQTPVIPGSGLSPGAGVNVSDPADSIDPVVGGDDGGGGGNGFLGVPGLADPDSTVVAVWAVLAVGLVAIVRRTGTAERAYRAAWLRYQPERDPVRDVRGAYDRVEYVLGRRTRERRPDETVREYLEGVRAGETARRVALLREQAVHAGSVDGSDAAEARRLAAEYARSARPGGDKV